MSDPTRDPLTAGDAAGAFRLPPPPREFSEGEAREFFAARPGWATGDEPLCAQYDRFGELLTTGRVRWAGLVMANRTMFEAGTNDSPGVIAYADDPAAPPEAAFEAGRAAAELKGDAVGELGAALHDELMRPLGCPVPDHPGFFASAINFPRAHLPGGRLGGPIFPILVAADESGVVAPLPAPFWPPRLAEDWARRAAEADAERAAAEREAEERAELENYTEWRDTVVAGLGEPPRRLPPDEDLFESSLPLAARLWPPHPARRARKALRRALPDGALVWGIPISRPAALQQPGRTPRRARFFVTTGDPDESRPWDLPAAIAAYAAFRETPAADTPEAGRLKKVAVGLAKCPPGGLAMPAEAVGRAEVRLYEALVDPGELPGRRLAVVPVPLLASDSRGIAVVPGRFWPDRFRAGFEALGT